MQTKGRYDTMELLSKQADWIGESRLAGYARLREGQPYQIAEEMEIVGVTMEKRLSFRGHIAQILNKAQVRLATLGRLAGCKWGGRNWNIAPHWRGAYSKCPQVLRRANWDWGI